MSCLLVGLLSSSSGGGGGGGSSGECGGCSWSCFCYNAAAGCLMALLLRLRQSGPSPI